MKTSNMEVLIFSGFNQRAVISFCRFCKRNNINLSIIASSKSDSILKTTYKSNVIHIRESRDFSVAEFKIYKNKIACEQILILPSTEYLNRFLLNCRKDIEDIGFTIPLCEEKLYEEISDKYDFGRLCESYNINVPKEFHFPDEFKNPFVAKPRRYFNQLSKIDKPLLIFNINDYSNFKESYSISDFYFQEFIGGKSYYLLFYFSKNGNYSVYSQENLMQQSNGGSIIAAKSSTIHTNEVTKYFIQLFISKGFSGLVMVEVKFYNGQFFMIEANPRLWGPSQLILDAQMDLFHNFLSDYGLISGTFQLNYIDNIKYFWSGGIIKEQTNQNEIAFHDYSEVEFFKEYSSLIKNDVYAHADTFEIFQEENQLK